MYLLLETSSHAEAHVEKDQQMPKVMLDIADYHHQAIFFPFLVLIKLSSSLPTEPVNYTTFVANGAWVL
jgi:hypothetical protein